MNLLTTKKSFGVNVAVTIAVGTLFVACAPIHHRHVDSRGELTSRPVTGYGYDYAYDPYRHRDYAYYDRGYYRPDYHHSGDYYRRSKYRCDRSTDPYRNIDFENGRSYYAPCYSDRYHDDRY
jgi:hypothetical protein